MLIYIYIYIYIYIGASEGVGGGIGPPPLFTNMKGAKYFLPKILQIYY